jgi:hypothetical protein
MSALKIFGILLHEKHESYAWHESPLKLFDKFVVQRSHPFLAQISQCSKARLDLLRCDGTHFLSDLLEFGIRHLLVYVARHVAESVAPIIELL